MQEVHIQHGHVAKLNRKLTNTEKEHQGLEAQLQQYKETQAVSALRLWLLIGHKS